jgi:hypothetical protein
VGPPPAASSSDWESGGGGGAGGGGGQTRATARACARLLADLRALLREYLDTCSVAAALRVFSARSGLETVLLHPSGAAETRAASAVAALLRECLALEGGGGRSAAARALGRDWGGGGASSAAAAAAPVQGLPFVEDALAALVYRGGAAFPLGGGGGGGGGGGEGEGARAAASAAASGDAAEGGEDDGVIDVVGAPLVFAPAGSARAPTSGAAPTPPTAADVFACATHGAVLGAAAHAPARAALDAAFPAAGHGGGSDGEPPSPAPLRIPLPPRSAPLGAPPRGAVLVTTLRRACVHMFDVVVLPRAGAVPPFSAPPVRLPAAVFGVGGVNFPHAPPASRESAAADAAANLADALGRAREGAILTCGARSGEYPVSGRASRGPLLDVIFGPPPLAGGEAGDGGASPPAGGGAEGGEGRAPPPPAGGDEQVEAAAAAAITSECLPPPPPGPAPRLVRAPPPPLPLPFPLSPSPCVTQLSPSVISTFA